MTSSPTASLGDGKDADEEKDAMMAEMGFASFGSKGKGPKAKRVKVRRNGEAEVGTGGNVMPLGRGRRGGSSLKERTVGRGQREGRRETFGKVLGTGIVGVGSSAAVAVVMGEGKVGSGLVEKADEEDEGGVRLPSEIARKGEEEAYEDPCYDDDDGNDKEMPTQPELLYPQKRMPNALPSKPPTGHHPAMGALGTSGGGQGQGQRRMDGKKEDGSWDWQALRKGVKDERGDLAFYDGSFVEDPWRALRGERM